VLDLSRLVKVHENELTTVERDAVMRFLRVADSNWSRVDLESEPRQLVFHDRGWGLIRRAARECLEEVGFDLHSWEAEQGL
jgi:hypothetical protein